LRFLLENEVADKIVRRERETEEKETGIQLWSCGCFVPSDRRQWPRVFRSDFVESVDGWYANEDIQ
jgi:hypothetical protein